MNRFSRIVNLVPSQLQPKPVRVGLDLGSSTTRVRVGDSLRYQQPSCVIVHNSSGEIISFGKQAARYQPGVHRQTIFKAPVRKAAVTDIALVADYLDLVLSTAIPQQTVATQLKATLIIPTDATKTETYILDKTFNRLGKGRWKLVRKNRLWEQALTHRSFNDLAGVLDFGGDTTEVVIRGDQGTHAKTIYLGGRQLVKRVIQVIRAEHGFQLSWKSGEDIVHNVDLTVLQTGSAKQIVVRGKNMSTNKPDTVVLDGEKVYLEVAQFYQELTDAIFLFLGTLPAEVLTRTLESGIYCSGGLSQISGIAEYMQDILDTSVVMSDAPSEELVRLLF